MQLLRLVVAMSFHIGVPTALKRSVWKLKFLQFGETSALFYQVASRWSADTFDVCHRRVPLSPAFEFEVHSRRVNLRVSRRQVAVSFASAVAAQARQR